MLSLERPAWSIGPCPASGNWDLGRVPTIPRLIRIMCPTVYMNNMVYDKHLLSVGEPEIVMPARQRGRGAYVTNLQ